MSETSEAVDEYIAGFAEPVQQRLREVRAAIHRAVPGAGETMRYQMPAMTLDGHYFVHIAGWKQHIGLYPVPVLEAALEAEVAPYRAAKDTVKLLHRQPLPIGMVERLAVTLAERRRSTDVC